MEREWTKWTEYAEKEKDELIEILKQANAEKDRIIEKQASDLVFANKRIMNREDMQERIVGKVIDELLTLRRGHC